MQVSHLLEMKRPKLNNIHLLCNSLQKIPHHPPGPKEMQVFAKCDDFMSALMERLQLAIPPFKLKRRVRVAGSAHDDRQTVEVTVSGLDNHNDQPYSFIKVQNCNRHS